MKCVYLPAIAVALSAGAATADLYTFDSLVHGEIITNQFEPALSISGINPNRPHDIVAAFDTEQMGTADPDLEGPPWAGGNLAAAGTVLGRALFISTNDTDANNDGILDDPNDEGNRPAGSITLSFMDDMSEFGFDVIDIEGLVQELSSLEFYNDGMLVSTVSFTEFTDMNSQYFDASIVFGNNNANRVAPMTAAQLGGVFDQVIINVGGSAAFDNIFVTPTPSSAALLGLGGLVATRRRR